MQLRVGRISAAPSGILLLCRCRMAAFSLIRPTNYPAYGLSGDDKSLLVVDKRLLFRRREDGTKIHLGA
ncbi:hypothetical protein EDP2_985 [Enterobacter cloacae S611]|uniref:Uncharacterized protein n=1 Tax=Enterobacter cloacae S611 TaxID=1399146 RepID=A0ABN0Q660_ENTCL|nr:hypothetical protein EDP2_985 [Enterobacter cloacae S611]